MKTRITLIRHGRTAWNVNGRWQGHACIPLDEEGVRQATRLADHLAAGASANDTINALYTSDLLRARQTAEIVAQRLGIDVRPDVRLREIDMGEWQGLTRAELLEWDTVRFNYVMEDPQTRRRPGGENGHDVAFRLHTALAEYAAAYPDGHLIVVTHGSAIYNLLYYLKLIGEYHGPLGNTGMTRLIHDLAQPMTPWSLSAFNILDHLEDKQREAKAESET